MATPIEVNTRLVKVIASGVSVGVPAGFLEEGNNLSDLTDVEQARLNLGLGVYLALDTDGTPYIVTGA